MSQTEEQVLLDELPAEEVELGRRLLELRQEPGPALGCRIRSIPHRKARPLWAPGPGGRLPRLAWVSAMVLVAALLFVSPAAQAMLGSVEQVIGRIQLMALEILPEPIATEALPEQTRRVVIASTPMSIAEAQTIVPFDIVIPAYLPPALLPEQEVSVTRLESPLVTVRWRDTQGGFVQLTALPYSTHNDFSQALIGPDSSRTVSINGRRAAIVSGAWDQTSRTWSRDSQIITLIWEVDDIQYRLISYSRVLSPTDLIAIAESVR